jgi:hypothetical protein
LATLNFLGKPSKGFRKFPSGLPNRSENYQFPSKNFRKFHQETDTYQRLTTELPAEGGKNFFVTPCGSKANNQHLSIALPSVGNPKSCERAMSAQGRGEFEGADKGVLRCGF